MGNMNFDWQVAYPLPRTSVYAKNVVATSQPLAAQARLQRVQRGGNAVDATIATAAVTIVEPVSNDLQNPQAAYDAPGWRVHKSLNTGLESQMKSAVVDGSNARGHTITPVNDNYMNVGAGQFIWRLGDTMEEGYVATDLQLAFDPR